jgi:hypothetical protein
VTCAEVRVHLDSWPAVRRQAVWGALVRHTWECGACLAQLVLVTVIAERVRAAVSALPEPPDGVRRAILGAEGRDAGAAAAGTRDPRPGAATRLAQIRPYLPPLLRLAADPLTVVSAWLPAPLVQRPEP